MVQLKSGVIPVFFHFDQLEHQPQFEWISGEKILHPESSTRAEGILGCLNTEPGEFVIHSPEAIPEDIIRQVHSPELIQVYLSTVHLASHLTVYPSVFPVGQSVQHVNPANIWHAGAFCLDSGTPLQNSTWSASGWSAACAFEGARLLHRNGNNTPFVYSLCRPPGHHATRDHFGGYCYLNNVAIAAAFLKQFGRIAIVDIDIHHGNGTQAIFYGSNEVFFISLHGDPENHYPYFWGSESERGVGNGLGYNLNLPLPAGTSGQTYLRVVRERVLPVLRQYDPEYLLVSAGFDTADGDPLGTFKLVRPDFFELGQVLGSLGRKTLVVQEGGYDTADLGLNVLSFLKGLKASLKSP